jgi:pimeloyl-ACP methyl ester carboxylesterase
VEDIECVRRALVGERGTVLLYGRSGGGYLVHEYLMRHGARVARAFTQAPVCPVLNRELGIPLDRWWRGLRDRDPELHVTLRRALARDSAQRVPLLITLQRLHFFVPADSFETTVRRLARAIAAGDTAAYARARTEYQTDAVLELERSNESIPTRVRELEPRDPEAIAPLLETQAEFVAPLLERLRSGALPPPAFDLDPAHRLATEVCIVTGRWDEAVDYRTSIALAAAYPRHRLVIADDNHTLSGLNEAGLMRRIVESFLTEGLDSAAFRAALAAAGPRLWGKGD